MDTKKAAEILDQAIESESYSNKLLVYIQQIYRTKKINGYEYERLINILSCQILNNEAIKKAITNHIVEESAKQMHFDVRV